VTKSSRFCDFAATNAIFLEKVPSSAFDGFGGFGGFYLATAMKPQG